MIKLKFEVPAIKDAGVWRRFYEAVMAKVEAGELGVEKPFRFYVTDTKLTRTPKQHRYYWGVVVKTFSEASGMEPEDVHDVWKRAYAGHRYEKWNGARRRVYNSTTAMNTKEMGAYMDRCIQFCAENGVVVPHPEKLTDEQVVALDSEGLLKAK